MLSRGINFHFYHLLSPPKSLNINARPFFCLMRELNSFHKFRRILGKGCFEVTRSVAASNDKIRNTIQNIFVIFICIVEHKINNKKGYANVIIENLVWVSKPKSTIFLPISSYSLFCRVSSKHSIVNSWNIAHVSKNAVFVRKIWL
jgi:hypothetical protein